MCDPVTIGMVGLGVSVVGGAVGAIGALQSGQQQAQSYEDQAAFAERHGKLERQAGAYERDRIKARNDRALAGMTQQYVSAGIDPTSGSAMEVIEDSAREAALDEEAVLFGAKIRSDNQRFTAKLARSNAKSAVTGSFFDAAGSLLGGITQGASFLGQRTQLTNPFGIA